ncbi:hypothetical protein KIM372_14690 [Bombiscardovia nodaiensis]|uniref:Uncharacterized protein n=1 Tax=Bombiscardovia nodaiensis TaxID=2932181 RepID=A0ABN6SBR9_9BIFI|nr:hypothetical protein KIM372_14690 [Bombiscardovia nodaiensis]
MSAMATADSDALHDFGGRAGDLGGQPYPNLRLNPNSLHLIRPRKDPQERLIWPSDLDDDDDE